jgi:hypothetical protein
MNSNSEVAQRANHQVAKSAADDLLLTLAIDRVLEAPRQVWSVTDNDGNDDFDADRGDNPSLIDWTLALALAAWP